MNKFALRVSVLPCCEDDGALQGLMSCCEPKAIEYSVPSTEEGLRSMDAVIRYKMEGILQAGSRFEAFSLKGDKVFKTLLHQGKSL